MKNILFDSNKQLFYFMHIPKTAGTSVTVIIDNIFKDTPVFPYKVWNDYISNDLEDFSNVANKMLRGYGYIRGHFGRTIEKESIKPIYLFTMLRNPIERTFSQYKHMLRDQNHNNWAPANYLDLTLHPVLLMKSDDASRVFGNVIQKTLCSKFDYRKTILNKIKKNNPNSNRYSLLSTPEFTKNSGILRLIQSLYTLSKINLVGITEYLPESMALLSIATNTEPPDIKALKVRMMAFNDDVEKNYRLDNELRRAISSLNKCDVIIYKIAKYQFEINYTKCVNSLVGSEFTRKDLHNPIKRKQMYDKLTKKISKHRS